MTSLGWVMGAISEAVAVDVRSVATAVNVELSCENDSGDEGEEDGQGISHDDGNCWNGLGNCTADTDNQDDPAEDCYEHGIVDTRWVPGEGFRNDVSNESSDEKDPNELDTSEHELNDIHFCG